MRKMIIPLLATIFLSGCYSKDDQGQNANEKPVPIRLQSNVLVTKAPITNGTVFKAAIAGWEGSTVNYGQRRNWETKAPITANSSTQNVVFDNKQYYNPTESINTYMKAWYPAGTLADNGIVTFAGDDDFKADGSTDVLLAAETSGNKLNTTGQNLAFVHPLSQVRFKVVASPTMAAAQTLNSITIKQVALPKGIDLVNHQVLYSDAADLLVSGITPVNITTGAAAQEVGNPMMFKPLEGKTFNIKVVTSTNTYENATVTIADDDKFVAGKAYTILLSFGAENEIKVNATVAEWLNGSGSGFIE